jgi:hypothetical protein
MSISIHTPSVIAEARREGITELQAYRRAQQREAIKRKPSTFPLRFASKGDWAQ